jgi:hypothetical protein
MAHSVSVLLRDHPDDGSPDAFPSPGARRGFSLRLQLQNFAFETHAGPRLQLANLTVFSELSAPV